MELVTICNCLCRQRWPRWFYPFATCFLGSAKTNLANRTEQEISPWSRNWKSLTSWLRTCIETPCAREHRVYNIEYVKDFECILAFTSYGRNVRCVLRRGCSYFWGLRDHWSSIFWSFWTMECHRFSAYHLVPRSTQYRSQWDEMQRCTEYRACTDSEASIWGAVSHVYT
jgi:hypothetical protein